MLLEQKKSILPSSMELLHQPSLCARLQHTNTFIVSTSIHCLFSFLLSHQLTFVMQIRGDRENLKRNTKNNLLIVKILKMSVFRVF